MIPFSLKKKKTIELWIMGPGHLEQAILGLRSIPSDHQFSPEADVLLVPCRGERWVAEDAEPTDYINVWTV